jgi:hypothetical protein
MGEMSADITVQDIRGMVNDAARELGCPLPAHA